jgi:hypothetical protein
LRARADELLDHFVDAARTAGCSWTDIGCSLGVSKRAAQQRFAALASPPPGAMPFELEGPSAEVPRARPGDDHNLQRFAPQAARPDSSATTTSVPSACCSGLSPRPRSSRDAPWQSWASRRRRCESAFAERLGAATPRPTGSLGVAPQTKRILELSRAIAKRLGHSRCPRTEHIMLAAVSPKLRSPAATVLAECGIGAEQVRDQLARMLLLEAPELADRLQRCWPLATFRFRGL